MRGRKIPEASGLGLPLPDMNEKDRGYTRMDINETLNELLVNLFHNINSIEEKAVRAWEYKDLTTNDMHVIDAIGVGTSRNMTSLARQQSVTTGTLTISINSLVKKGYVERVRSEEDRRVVLVSLTGKGKRAFRYHRQFHDEMIRDVVRGLTEEEQEVLRKSLENLMVYFQEKNQG